MKEKLQWEVASHLLKGLKCRRSVISSLDKDMDNWNSHILLVGNFVVSNKFGHKAYPMTSNFYPLTHAENNSYLCFWTMVLEKTLESRLDSKKIKPINPKGNQSWLFIGRTDAEAETPTLWPPDAKNWLIGKDPNTGKVWRQEEKRMTEDEMVGWHHQLNGRSLSILWELVMDREAWCAAVHGVTKIGHDLETELNWTEAFQ